MARDAAEAGARGGASRPGCRSVTPVRIDAPRRVRVVDRGRARPGSGSGSGLSTTRVHDREERGAGARRRARSVEQARRGEGRRACAACAQRVAERPCAATSSPSRAAPVAQPLARGLAGCRARARACAPRLRLVEPRADLLRRPAARRAARARPAVSRSSALRGGTSSRRRRHSSAASRPPAHVAFSTRVTAADTRSQSFSSCARRRRPAAVSR